MRKEYGLSMWKYSICGNVLATAYLKLATIILLLLFFPLQKKGVSQHDLVKKLPGVMTFSSGC